VREMLIQINLIPVSISLNYSKEFYLGPFASSRSSQAASGPIYLRCTLTGGTQVQ